MAIQVTSIDFMDRLRRTGRAMSSGRGAMPGWLPRLIEILLVILLAWLAMRLVFAFSPDESPAGTASPMLAGSAAGPADLAVFQRFDPFAARAVTASDQPSVEDARETSLDITLQGIWAETDGTGLAIIEAANSQQRMYQTGDEIMAGVTLDRLYADRAIILRNGRRESVFLENRIAPEARPATATASQAPAGRESVSAPSNSRVPPSAGGSMASLSSVVAVRPVRQGSQTIGYELFPRGDGALFTSLGFQEGDRIVALNGTPAPANSERLIDLMQSLAGTPVVTVRVDRGGEQVDLSIDTSELQ